MTAISIVTISYNQLPFLKRAVASVQGQDFTDYEHIVVDPGSDDGSREWLDTLVDTRLVKLFQKDDGPADGLNKGIAAATGDIVMYLNSDDELAPSALRKTAEFHQQDPDSDVIVGNGWWIDKAGRPVGHVRSDRFTPKRYSLSVATVLQQSTTFKRRLFLKGLQFNIRNKISWDSELLFDAYYMGANFAYVNEDLGYFRLHDQSITVSGKFEALYHAEEKRLRQISYPNIPYQLLIFCSFFSRGIKRIGKIYRDRKEQPRFPGLVESTYDLR
jgi:glycosyltransferase involved in cell wall biosynthesis